MDDSIDFVGRYYSLCDKRDAVNKQNEPLEAELSKLVADQEALRVKAEKVAAQIDANRGGEKWLALKREIRIIASGLGRIPPRPQ